jgi:hypothetical protein
MSAQKPSHEVEGIVRRAPRQDCVEAQICSIEGPQEKWPPSFLNGGTFGTTNTLPRAGSLAKLSNQGTMDGHSDSHSDRTPEFLCGDGKTFQKDKNPAALHQSDL